LQLLFSFYLSLNILGIDKVGWADLEVIPLGFRKLSTIKRNIIVDRLEVPEFSLNFGDIRTLLCPGVKLLVIPDLANDRVNFSPDSWLDTLGPASGGVVPDRDLTLRPGNSFDKA
jgi:hypothetical protein